MCPRQNWACPVKTQSKLSLCSQNSVKTQLAQSKLSQNSVQKTHSQVNRTQSQARKARCVDPPPTWRYACCVQKCNGGAAVVKPGSAAMYADQNPRRCEAAPRLQALASNGWLRARGLLGLLSLGVLRAVLRPKDFDFLTKPVGHQIIFLFSWTTAQGRVPRTV